MLNVEVKELLKFDLLQRYDVKEKKSFYAGKVVTSPINHQVNLDALIYFIQLEQSSLVNDTCKDFSFLKIYPYLA